MRFPRDVSGREGVKALRLLRYEPMRQEGSHIRLRTDLNGEFQITVPAHKSLKLGTLRSILKVIAEHHGLDVQELLSKLEL